ncbi:DUF1987 domain-containing protein [Brumimicrobium sp.]|uniref:DUF1987 domain-containing protein n=1 Tax=Brumimicrobium sp. TaxID=2029867 RepID=UPI0026317BEE|nr:DUF1987 domain-containing protein [uncultured Brumimicrobium sp.]
MEVLEKAATANTPYINFNSESGIMLIQGRAIPQPADEFWAPVLKWFYAYSSAPNTRTELVFNMEYFNISTSKQILFLLHKMNDLFEKGHDVVVVWKYTKEDVEMKEAGFDFSCVVNVPFEFKRVEVEPIESF